MATSKKTFVDIELEFAEKKLAEWKEYMEANPISGLKDRIEWKPTSKGGMLPMVIASVEQQGKFLQETLKNYLALLKEVDMMREKEEIKQKQVRGDQNLSPFENGDI